MAWLLSHFALLGSALCTARVAYAPAVMSSLVASEAIQGEARLHFELERDVDHIDRLAQQIAQWQPSPSRLSLEGVTPTPQSTSTGNTVSSPDMLYVGLDGLRMTDQLRSSSQHATLKSLTLSSKSPAQTSLRLARPVAGKPASLQPSMLDSAFTGSVSFFAQRRQSSPMLAALVTSKPVATVTKSTSPGTVNGDSGELACRPACMDNQGVCSQGLCLCKSPFVGPSCEFLDRDQSNVVWHSLNRWAESRNWFQISAVLDTSVPLFAALLFWAATVALAALGGWLCMRVLLARHAGKAAADTQVGIEHEAWIRGIPKS